MRLTASISGAPGALLSSDDYGSSVERRGGGHPVYGDESVGCLWGWPVSHVLAGWVACANSEIGRDGQVHFLLPPWASGAERIEAALDQPRTVAAGKKVGSGRRNERRSAVPAGPGLFDEA
jgi:hypothetical protein